MARTTPRKVTPKLQSVGGARPANFQSTDMELHGYWLPEKQDARVEVPIFQHAFYPTLKHTDLDIKQNISYRPVVLPSLSTLRAHGIEAERAVFVAEVAVHPRYIKHANYFRGDFPAIMKSLARRENIVFIIAANDIPSARLKRKKVLNFWRLSFSPLLLKGRQYTSGRMGFFMVAPPESVTKFKKSLNLEAVTGKDVQKLLEWNPAVNRTRRPRKRGPRSRYTAEERRLANELVKETSDKLSNQLLPVITSKFDIDPHSDTAKQLDAYLSNPATSRGLIKATEGKRNRMWAVKKWVKTSMLPRVKEIAKDEAAMAGESIVRFIVLATITTTVNFLLSQVQASRAGKKFSALQKLEYKPSRMASHTQVGAGTLSFKFSPNAKDLSSMQQQVAKKVMMDIMTTYKEWTYNSAQESIFDITLNLHSKTKPVTIKLDRVALRVHRAHNKEGLGPFGDSAKDNYLVQQVLPAVEREVNIWFEHGRESEEENLGLGLSGY